MKIYLVLIILIFSLQFSTKADDISEFEVEGISVGDSLFEHFSKNEINEGLNNRTYYKDKSFFEIFLNKRDSNFDYLQIALKTNDQSYKIEKIMLLKDFSNQIEKCNKFKKKFISETIEFLDNAERIDNESVASADPSGKSYIYISTFYLPSGDFFNFSCTDYDKGVIEKRGWFDSFKVSIGSKEIAEYLNSDKAY